ncbi:MAG: hypothetical protein H0W89_01055 [Candidatus Levybacteria bacterium]|nr:hypothetical protein [Candidatus Levybacteria bacterium]
MPDLEVLKTEVEKLKTRNKRVEANKAWETSFTRKVTLAGLTYFVIGLTLTTIKNPDPWINAIIPTLGFLLSTLSLPYIKDVWERYRHPEFISGSQMKDSETSSE